MTAQKQEQVTFDDLDKNIQDIVKRLEEYGVGGEENQKLSISKPTVKRVSESISELTIKATSKSNNGGSLTYKLLRGTTADNITEIELEPESINGNTVTFKDTGLEMAQPYYYKVQVIDENGDVAISTDYASERTYCLGSFCEGGGEREKLCPECGFNIGGTVECSLCSGSGSRLCRKEPA